MSELKRVKKALDNEIQQAKASLENIKEQLLQNNKVMSHREDQLRKIEEDHFKKEERHKMAMEQEEHKRDKLHSEREKLRQQMKQTSEEMKNA